MLGWYVAVYRIVCHMKTKEFREDEDLCMLVSLPPASFSCFQNDAEGLLPEKLALQGTIWKLSSAWGTGMPSSLPRRKI